MFKKIKIKKGRAKPLYYGNPWVFPHSIADMEDVQKGEIVSILDERNNHFIGYGFYNPDSFFRVRILSWEEKKIINASFFREKIRQAIALRKNFYHKKHNAFRLINAEGDGLPGFTADFYNGVVILKITSFGYYAWINTLIEILKTEIEENFSTKILFIINKLTPEEIKEEKIENYTPILYGEPQEQTLFYQDGLEWILRPLDLQKTGFYLDQRWNRLFLRHFFQGQKMKILDAYCYNAAFSHYLYEKQKEIIAVDSSKNALALAKENLLRNNIENVTLIEEDTVHFLRKSRDYDLIILDPPKIMKKKEHYTDAIKKYQHLNFMAALALKNNGFLATFSCSGNLSLQDFQQTVAEGLKEAGKKWRIIYQTVNSPDHPYSFAIPETGYLKFLLIQLLDA